MLTFYQAPLFWVFVLSVIIQLVIYLFLFRKVISWKPPKPKAVENLPPVSVIIAARNEYKNLEKNLHLILSQDYPNFEVIVVNDQSWDDSNDILEKLAVEFPHLKIVSIKDHINAFEGKKFALTLGIKAALNEILIFTDADCYPAHNKWLHRIMDAYTDNTNIVLGYSPYSTKNSLLNIIVQFDTYYTALQYFSFSLAGRAYMGVGRNLSYRKSLFFKSKGFAPYLRLPSGDDDLFVNMHSHPETTKIQMHEESFMISAPKESWSAWMRQKRRHLQAGKFYKNSDKKLLGLLWLSNFYFYASFVLALIYVTPFWVILIGFGIRLFVQAIIMFLTMEKLYVRNIWHLFPLLDLGYQLLYLHIMSIISLKKPRRSIW